MARKAKQPGRLRAEAAARRRPVKARRAKAPPATGRSSGGRGGAVRHSIPHYRQTTDFTCGPSSALMAMKALDAKAPFGRAQELQIWREATSVFMGPSGGHGGCGPVALALALHRRGFKTEVHVNHRGVFLGERTRSAERREVMRVMQKQDVAEAKRAGIPIHYDRLSQAELEMRLREGLIPIVLVSTRFIHGDHAAHWVVVTGFDGDHVFVNDPWVALDKGKTPKDMTHYPVPRRAFDAMARYGKRRERACVLVGR
jgi:hypothetical protein